MTGSELLATIALVVSCASLAFAILSAQFGRYCREEWRGRRIDGLPHPWWVTAYSRWVLWSDARPH